MFLAQEVAEPLIAGAEEDALEVSQHVFWASVSLCKHPPLLEGESRDRLAPA